MKKVVILGVAVAFLCAAGFSSMTLAEDEDKGPAEITLQTEEAKKPAVFPHAAHQERIECAKCHEDPNYVPGAWTKEAGHALCQECHKNVEDAEQAKELKKCTTCHPKKNGE
ncbi:MAG: cytochrome c3 family protein [Desulfobulbaceae bacterium]|nr:cytochrome c3 family protein [Desulfobulbaceae bacterium]